MATRVIDLLRHGEPVGGHRYRGNGVDDPLTEKGWRQMWAGVGDEGSWDLVVSSPMRRCSAFAEVLAERQGIEMIVDERFREIGFGEWEGKTRDQLKQESGDDFRDFYTDPVANTPAGAEPVSEFYQRVSAAFLSLRKQYPENNFLIVAHAGVNRAIVADAIRLGMHDMYNITIQNGCVARLIDANEKLILQGLNLQLSLNRV